MTKSDLSKKDVFTYCGKYVDFRKDLENENTTIIPSWMLELFRSKILSLEVSTGYNFYNIVLNIDEVNNQNISIINFTDHHVFGQEDYFIRISKDHYVVVDYVNLTMMKLLLPDEIYQQFITTLFGEFDINLTVRR